MIHDDHLAGVVEQLRLTAGTQDLEAAVGDVRTVFLCVGQQLPVHMGLNTVIAVDECDVFSGGGFNATEPCGGNAAVFFVNGDDAAVPLGIGIYDLGRMIRRAVIDHDDLQILVGLGQHAVQCDG